MLSQRGGVVHSHCSVCFAKHFITWRGTFAHTELLTTWTARTVISVRNLSDRGRARHP